MKQNLIAIVFDFDETLAKDSTSGFLNDFGINPAQFWREVGKMYESGWDPVPAYLYHMLEESAARKSGSRMTKARFRSWAKRVSYYRGVSSIFKRLQNYAKRVNPGVKIEYYLISSGIGELLKSTRIARNFKEIWACDFIYNTRGEISFPKNIVSFTDKTRYIFQIAKGIIGPHGKGQPFAVNRAISAKRLRIPYDQIIFVGDGYTDIPCFSLVRKQGGIAFGVYDPHDQSKWSRAWSYVEDQRITNLVPADYRKDSALTHSLMMAINRIATNIQLRQNSFQG